MSTAIQLFKQPSTDLLMQADAEGMHVKGTDRRLISAEGGTAIGKMDPQRLVEDINAIVKGASRDMGIHTEPDAFDKSRFLQVLRDYFPTLTTMDVRSAFELYVLGDLDAFLPKDSKGKPIGHYQKWSMQFYVAVLRAYRSRQLEAKRDVSGRLELVLTERALDARNPFDERCAFVELLKSLIVKVACGESPIMSLTASADYVLKKVKLIPDMVVPNDGDYADARDRLSHNKGSVVRTAFEKALRTGAIPTDLEAAAKALAVRRMMRDEAMRIGPEQVAMRFDWYISRVRAWEAQQKAKAS